MHLKLPLLNLYNTSSIVKSDLNETPYSLSTPSTLNQHVTSPYVEFSILYANINFPTF